VDRAITGRGNPTTIEEERVEHHDERADELEREADKLEQHTEHVGERIADVRKDWESKQEDQSVPGAQPEPGDDPDNADEDEE
jgi:hypothetical protein